MTLLPSRPDTPMGVVEGFFSGITSGLFRTLLALTAIFFAGMLCLLCSGLQSYFFWVWLGLIFAAIFVWGSLGAWFFIGLLSLIGMFAALWAFVHDHRAPLSFFLTFTAAVIYFAPVTFSEYHWIWLLLAYLVCAACYWFLPYAIRRASSPSLYENGSGQ